MIPCKTCITFPICKSKYVYKTKASIGGYRANLLSERVVECPLIETPFESEKELQQLVQIFDCDSFMFPNFMNRIGSNEVLKKCLK